MPTRLPPIWDADPHTLAKIAILKGYLHAWFRILGARMRRQVILYVDGFAGPGHYRNHDEGSPLAAVRAAVSTLESLGSGFVAAKIHCAFIESRRDRFRALKATIAPFLGVPRLGITLGHCDFVEGMNRVRTEVPGPFQGEGPLLVFADPFGGTGIPFRTFSECMAAGSAELLVNLDADGIGRIFLAGTNNRRDEQLTELFGCESWRTELTTSGDLRALSAQILALYKKQLRTLPSLNYVWSFAMRGAGDTLNYYLVFATKHPLGMEKMKEAMKAIDDSGGYTFSDAHVDQLVLFRGDNEDVYAQQMFAAFNGRSVAMAEVIAFALNETPFTNPKSMLGVLHGQDRLRLEPVAGARVRNGTFPEDKIHAITFGHFGAVQRQTELF